VEEVVQRLSEWLVAELAGLPPTITALYVEHGECVSADHTLTVYADAFGFERLARSVFDPADRNHVAELGDFVWQARQPPHFVAAVYTALDWTAALEAAVKTPDVQCVLGSRGLHCLVGEHDGDVRVVR
jgi:hypothetical protein